jgi:hypothetical protein
VFQFHLARPARSTKPNCIPSHISRTDLPGELLSILTWAPPDPTRGGRHAHEQTTRLSRIYHVPRPNLFLRKDTSIRTETSNPDIELSETSVFSFWHRPIHSAHNTAFVKQQLKFCSPLVVCPSVPDIRHGSAGIFRLISFFFAFFSFSFVVVRLSCRGRK